MTSIACRRRSIASIDSKISRWAGRKKSSGAMLVATSSNAAGLMKIDPRTDFSASRLCGGVRPAAAEFELTTSSTDIARDSTPAARAR